jgi:site-specific DNA-methyltransferase (adenine-specific)
MTNLLQERLPLNQIICGDCLEVMRTLPSESVDCVITSPPYNVGNNNMTENKYGGGDAMNKDDYFEWLKSNIDELLRVTKNHIFFNIQMLSDNKRGVLKLLGEYNEKIKDIIIWDKIQVAPAIEGGVMNSKFEFIIIFSNDFPEKRKFTDGNFHGNFNNVITGKSASNENKWSDKHKAIFPLYLPETIIKQFTKEGDLICDPFMGLGTTAVAAKNLKRNYLGIELNPEYIEIANKRLSQDLLF